MPLEPRQRRFVVPAVLLVVALALGWMASVAGQAAPAAEAGAAKPGSKTPGLSPRRLAPYLVAPLPHPPLPPHLRRVPLIMGFGTQRPFVQFDR